MCLLIKGMKMPKNCEECILDHKFFKWLGCYKHVSGDTIADGKRSPACPLIELPTHGRIIDADALIAAGWQLSRDNIFTGKYEIALLSSVPTIIPGEESE